MPIVFVHGVNNRTGLPYQENEVARNAMLRQIVAPSLGVAPSELSILSPYWGDLGVKFAWDMSVLPDAGTTFERFGSDRESLAISRVLTLASGYPVFGGISALAKQNLADALDLLYGVTLAGVEDPDEARDVALSYLAATVYLRDNPTPNWVRTANDTNFGELLNFNLHPSHAEVFGAFGQLRENLNEGLSRLASALPAAGTAVLARVARKDLNSSLSRFVGDAMVYFASRGTLGNDGPIIKVVADALVNAKQAATATDSKLIVIAHSFGGEIAYDIATAFRPDCEIDCLITVGSQVGLFEEMKMYLASDPNIPLRDTGQRVTLPRSIKRWLNVFDKNDVLSYRVEPVFQGAEDYQYDTGYDFLSAHSGYFLRPSFYLRLAERLKANPLK
jgi:hypothetical protein